MFRFSRLLWLLTILATATAGGAVAQVGGFHFTLNPYVGYADWSHDVNLDNQVVAGGKLGIWPSKYFGLEGEWAWMGGAKTQHGPNIWPDGPTAPSFDQDIQSYGGDLVINILPDYVFGPYVFGGWLESKLKENDEKPAPAYENGPMAGVGVHWWIQPRIAFTAEVRDFIYKFSRPGTVDPSNGESVNNIMYSAGLKIALGGSLQDADKDGVSDKKDRCPDTPLGARVDSRGCPIDSDGDGVPDGLDQCANTPKGAKVDAKGCPMDSDKDGVYDGIDKCPDTPAGAKVDLAGCPIDSDGDGVADGLDECPNTPTGATVDAKGCPIDSDGDGVPDGLDKCPNTPANAKVDANGCPIEISEKEVELLDTGMIRVSNINFETGKWDILPASMPVLDEIGNILVQWPDLKIEIGGHTDSRGSEKMNLELSEKRANAVREYLISKFPKIQAEQYTAKGYGESKPIASNNTVEGMAKNRRVEFTVLNTEVLKKERENRRLLQK